MELTYYGVNCGVNCGVNNGVNFELSYPTVEYRDGWEVSQARLKIEDQPLPEDHCKLYPSNR